MSVDTLPNTFWATLESLNRHSRMVLVAIEDDNIDEVMRLTASAENMIAEIRPAIEARVAASCGSDEDRHLASMLHDLKRVNDRIRDELRTKADENAERLGLLRERRLRLVHYRPTEEPEAMLLDRDS